MTPEQLEKAIAGIRSVHQTTGHEGVAALAMAAALAKGEVSDSFDGITFDFNQFFPVARLILPPRNLNAAMPEGWTVEALDPWFQQLKNASDSSFGLTVDPPEGLTADQLAAAWDLVRLFFDSGAVLRQNTEHNVATARLHIQERGLSEVLIVLDEQYRVISGLPHAWALSELGSKEMPAVILHGAPQDAGWLHTHAEALKWGQTLWEKGEIQGVLESSTPAEREFFQGFGFHQVPEITTLTLSWDTFDRLAGLITKQLGGSTNHDPAQLLFVEALREAVLDARQRIIAAGKGKPNDSEKLERHLHREAEMTAGGEKTESRNQWEWSEDESGLWSHPAMPKFRFKIVEPEPIERVDSPSIPDPYLMSLSQFQLMARDHFGIAADDARTLYESEPADDFNCQLRRYAQSVGQIDRRGSSGPSEGERAKQAERLALWNRR